MNKIKKYLSIFVLLFAFVAIPVVFTGCQTGPTNKSAVAYQTLKDVWIVSFNAYQVFSEKVVRGQISPEREKSVDAAWNKFRESYKVALKVAGSDLKFTPDNVELLSIELLNLIK